MEEIRKFIGSDSLAFLPLDKLKTLLGDDALNYCYACFSGKYPVEPEELQMKRLGVAHFNWDDDFNGNFESIDVGGWVTNQDGFKIGSV